MALLPMLRSLETTFISILRNGLFSLDWVWRAPDQIILKWVLNKSLKCVNTFLASILFASDIFRATRPDDISHPP